MKDLKIKTYTIQEWRNKGLELYGTEDFMEWPLVCPSCEEAQKGKDLLALDIPYEKALDFLGFSCIGRLDGKRGCDWTLGGLFQIHTSIIKDIQHERPVFDFYEEEE